MEVILSVVPGTLGLLLRRMFYKLCLQRLGSYLRSSLRIKIQEPSNIEIGSNVSINYGVWIAANRDNEGGIIIGNDVLIGPYSILHTGNHNYRDSNQLIRKQGHNFKSIVVQDDVWIAARCTILAGVVLGKGSVVAAGSVVTKNVEPYSIVAGIPAKVIGQREILT